MFILETLDIIPILVFSGLVNYGKVMWCCIQGVLKNGGLVFWAHLLELNSFKSTTIKILFNWPENTYLKLHLNGDLFSKFSLFEAV